MKKYLLKMLKAGLPLLLIFAGLAAMSVEKEGKMDEGLSDEDKMLYRFINRQGKMLGEKYGMVQSANGLGGRDKVWLMCISFDRYGSPLNEEEARDLLIHCVQDFLDAVNSDEQVRPLLKDYPFTAKNLKLDIFIFDKDRYLQTFPSIAIVSNSKGKVCFFTKEAPDVYGYHTEKYETYDEALAILKGNDKSGSTKMKN